MSALYEHVRPFLPMLVTLTRHQKFLDLLQAQPTTLVAWGPMYSPETLDQQRARQRQQGSVLRAVLEPVVIGARDYRIAATANRPTEAELRLAADIVLDEMSDLIASIQQALAAQAAMNYLQTGVEGGGWVDAAVAGAIARLEATTDLIRLAPNDQTTKDLRTALLLIEVAEDVQSSDQSSSETV